MTMKDSLFLLISNVLGKGCGAWRGPKNDDEGLFFLLILNILKRGPSNDDEGFFISADFKCFRKGAPPMNMKDSLFLLI